MRPVAGTQLSHTATVPALAYSISVQNNAISYISLIYYTIWNNRHDVLFSFTAAMFVWGTKIIYF
jgi:hypothetical protein